MKFLKYAIAAAALTGLAACSDEGNQQGRLQGERISVLAFESRVEADPRLANEPLRLPRPYMNENWAQPGGYASHAMHHLLLDGPLRERWAAGVGIGAWEYGKLLVPPIIVGDVVFAADAEGHVSSFDLNSGKRFWTRNVSIRGEDPDENVGGGIAYGEGRIYISTGLGFVIAVEARTGKALWHRNMGLPFRAAPTYHNGRVYVISHDNQMFALDATSGETDWEYAALVEEAGLLGNSSVAIEDGTIIAPFTSGELVALQAENGKVLWQDSLTRTGKLNSLSSLADIAGRPVIDRGMVFAASHAGRLVAIDLRTGERVWTRNIASTQTPWVAGDFIFVVTVDAQIVCLQRSDGRIRWVTGLDRYEDPDDQEDPIVWSGPVLGSNRLIAVSSHGKAVSLSPYTGKIKGQVDIREGSFIPPVVARRTLIILNDEGEMIAYR